MSTRRSSASSGGSARPSCRWHQSAFPASCSRTTCARKTGYKWIKRFTQEARPGPYLQVVREGEVSAGDAIDVVHRPDHGITVTTMFKAFTTDRQLLPSLLDAGDDLIPDAREVAEAHTARTRASSG